VFEDVSAVDELAKPPWTTRYLQGHVEAPFINLTPGTRSGIIQDEAYAALLEALVPLETKLTEILEAQRRAEEEQASRELLQTIQRAFREAFLALPAEEYDWFDIHSRARGSGSALRNLGTTEKLIAAVTEPENGDGKQRQFFEFAGPLFTVAISPASSVVRVGEQRSLRALPYDRSRRRVETDLTFAWEVIEGGGALEHRHDQVATFIAPVEPGLVRVKVTVSQNETERSAEALIYCDARTLVARGNNDRRVSGIAGVHFRERLGRLVAVEI
jgi:hypothetical protein